MKNRIIIIIVIFMSGCIEADISKCPDFGKYKLIINDSNEYSNINQMNSIINIYNTNQRYYFTKEANCSTINRDGSIKLYPGIYEINCIVSNEPITICDSVKIKVNNGLALFNKIITKEIIKCNQNRVHIHTQLINSIIDIIADTTELFIHNYKLLSIDLSTPDDNNTFYNIDNNKINLSSSQSECIRYNPTNYISKNDVYRLYTIPISANCPIDIKCNVTKTDDNYNNSLTIEHIIGRLYINRDILSGDHCRIFINISPTQIIHTKTQIENWKDVPDNKDIDLG